MKTLTKKFQENLKKLKNGLKNSNFMGLVWFILILLYCHDSNGHE